MRGSYLSHNFYSQPDVIELQGILAYRRVISWKSLYFSKWAELIAKKATSFSQTSLCRKVFLRISGASGGDGICGSIEGRSILPCYLTGN